MPFHPVRAEVAMCPPLQRLGLQLRQIAVQRRLSCGETAMLPELCAREAVGPQAPASAGACA